MNLLEKRGKDRLTSLRSGRGNLKLAAALVFFSLLVGCSTMKEGLGPTEKANISLFADNTIALLSDSDFGMQKDTLVVTREYFDYTSPVAVEIAERSDEIDRIVTAVLDYSISIVSLSETDRTDAEKVTRYADYLEGFRSKVLIKTDMSAETFADMMALIRKQPELLSAFREAQPLVNAGMRYAATVLFEMDRLGDQAIREMENRIDADFAYATVFIEGLEDQKQVVLSGLEMLYRYQAGDRSTIKALRQNPWIRSKKALARDALDEFQISTLEEELLDHLSTLKGINWQLSDDIDYYQAAHNELDTVYNEFLQDNARARLALVIWARAHQKMASGILEPAKWFDISETPSLLINLGSKALW